MQEKKPFIPYAIQKIASAAAVVVLLIAIGAVALMILNGRTNPQLSDNPTEPPTEAPTEPQYSASQLLVDQAFALGYGQSLSGKHSLTGTIYCGGDRLFIDDSYTTKVLEALKSGEDVSFYIVESERTTTTYLFTVSTSNFAEKYETLFG